MRKHLTAAAFGLLLLGGTANADGDCHDLSLMGFNTGETATIAVTGAQANAPLTLALASAEGSTTFDFGTLGSLTLCLESPVALVPFGVTDGNGDFAVSFDVPDEPGLVGLTIAAQTVTYEVEFGGGPPTLDFCESDAETVSIEE